MKCQKCGTENLEENKFCSNCGEELIDNEKTIVLSKEEINEKKEELKNTKSEKVNKVEETIDSSFVGKEAPNIKKSKRENSFIVVLALLIVLVAVVCLIIKQVNDYDKKDNNQNNNIENNPIVENQEEVSQELKSDLKEKMAILLDDKSSTKNDENAMKVVMITTPYNLFNVNLFSNNLTNSEKLGLILSSMLDKANRYIGDDLNAHYRINESDVQQKAFAVFGTRLENESIEIECNTYKYENGYYDHGSGCGGTLAPHINTFIEEYELKENKIYVHTRIGEYQYYNVESLDSISCYILTDFVDQGMFKGGNGKNKTLDEVKQYVYKSTCEPLTEKDYLNFQEYIFVFEKDQTGNYFFKEVKKN